MCVALYPMGYDALSADAAVLLMGKACGENGAEKWNRESYCAVLAPGRKGLIFCFLKLLLFGQNRVEVRPQLDLLGRMRKRWCCINWARFCVENGRKLKILMCVLASVRIFFVVCFERVALNSTCGALSVRSGRPLADFEVTTGSILAGFWRRAIVTSLPQTAGTYPPSSAATTPFGARPPFARHGRVNPRPTTACKHNSALAPFVGAQKYY